MSKISEQMKDYINNQYEKIKSFKSVYIVLTDEGVEVGRKEIEKIYIRHCRWDVIRRTLEQISVDYGKKINVVGFVLEGKDKIENVCSIS
jgi:hypothetical protein